MYHGSYFFSYNFMNKTIQSYLVLRFCFIFWAFAFKDVSLYLFNSISNCGKADTLFLLPWWLSR